MLKIITSAVTLSVILLPPRSSLGQTVSDGDQDKIYAQAVRQVLTTQPAESLREQVVGLYVLLHQRDEQIAQLKSDLREALIRGGAPKDVDRTDAGGGFFVSNVSVKPPLDMFGKPDPDREGNCDVIGEIENDSGKDTSICEFTLSVYNSDGKLLSSSPFVIQAVASGKTKSFAAEAVGVPVRDASKWKILLDTAVPRSDK